MVWSYANSVIPFLILNSFNPLYAKLFFPYPKLLKPSFLIPKCHPLTQAPSTIIRYPKFIPS